MSTASLAFYGKPNLSLPDQSSRRPKFNSSSGPDISPQALGHLEDNSGQSG